MKTVAHIVFALAPVLLAAGIPFIRVARGGSILGPFLMCWGLLVFWVAFFSLGTPLICAAFSQELAHTVADWVPEGPGVVLVAFFGWFWAGVIVLLARATHWLRRKYAGTHNT